MKGLISLSREGRDALTEEETADVFTTPPEHFSIGVKKLHRALFTPLQEDRRKTLVHRAEQLNREDNRRTAFVQPSQCKLAKQRMSMIPRLRNLHDSRTFRMYPRTSFQQTSSLKMPLELFPGLNPGGDTPGK